MKSQILTILAAMLVVFSGCRQQANLTGTFQPSVVKSEVEDMLKAYTKSFNALDIDNTQKYIDDSEDFFWIYTPDKNPVNSDYVKKVIKKEIEKYRAIDIRFYYIRVNPLTENIAVYTGGWEEASENHKGDIEKFFGVETGVVIKRNGGWKFLNGQTCAHQEITEVK